ncbi:MAG: hypothetical protein PVH17_00205, partial [Anaerolineae bacterium]
MKRKAQLLAIVLLVGLSLVALGVLPQPGAARQPSPEQVVQRAWRNAQESGVYHFATELVQTTHPAPKLANAGRTSRVDSLYIEGETDLPSRSLQMALWQSGSLLDARDGVEIRVEGDQAYGRTAGSQTWEDLDEASISGTFAPDNDLLAYLAGAKNIRFVGNQGAGIGESGVPDSPIPDFLLPDSLTKYAFDLDGPAFAAYMRDRLEDHLRKQGELPAGLHLDISDLYRGMEGDGQIWVDADGLPQRLTLTAQFPQQANGQRIEVSLKTDFSHFDRGFLQARAEPQTPGQALVMGYHDVARALGLPRSAAEWQTLAQQSLVVLAFLGLAGLLLFQAGRRRLAHAALAALLIVSMVIPPLVQAQQVADFSQRMAARRAETEQAQAEAELQRELEAELAASAWEPNQDPLGNQVSGARYQKPGSGQQVAAVSLQSPAADTRFLIPDTRSLSSSATDPCANASADADADGDGLTDKQECRLGTDPNKADTDDDGLKDGAERRLGTDPKNADTDDDGLTDAAEVTAFTVGGKPWYTDPNSPDSNNDGLLDSEECRDRLRPVDAQGRPSGLSPTTACQDSDGDGTPDVFDGDNDDDGVPDRGDVSPYKALSGPFTLANSFKFSASGLHTDQVRPLLVDFQLRPANPERLAFALNVLDWPTGDSQGNVQETHGKTFADFMTAAQAEADSSAANGDLRLVPMLEILMGGQDLPLPLTEARAEYDWAYGLVLQGDPFHGTVALEKSGSGGSQFVFAFSGDTPDRVVLFQGSCGTLGNSLGEVQAFGSPWIRSERVTALANGQHVLMAWGNAKSACLPLADIPNGNDPERMVDTAALQAYGISVRDVDAQGNLAAYVPLYIVPDESGGGRVAFQGRMMYQPQATSWSNHHQINLVWTVQMLQTDGRTTIAHSYYDEWQLTGLAAREDYGLQVAVAWEDPGSDDNNAVDDRLWHLARGLQAAFLTGRDADGNGQRDLDVAGIGSRFDGYGYGYSDQQRWNIPRNALGVQTFSYPAEDHLAKIMMEETPRILNDHFNGQGVESPTLLFAQEAAARSVNLDVSDHTDWSSGVLRVEFGGGTPPALQTTASLSWAPFRQRNGEWESYPFAEYWDRMHVEFGDLFATTDTSEQAQDIAAGSVEIAAGYYLSLYRGLANPAGVNGRPGTEFMPVAPPGDKAMADAWNSAIGVKGGVLGDVVGNVAENGYDALEAIAEARASMSDLELLFTPGTSRVEKFKEFVGKGLKGTLSANWGAFGSGL